MFAEDFLVSMKVYNSTIYVGFGFLDKLKIIHDQIKGSKPNIDQTVIHELSYVLWNKVKNNNIPQSQSPRLWHEGFATYCEEDYFSELYPNCYKLEKDYRQVCREGKQQVERVIQRHGIEALLEIPNRWEEFEKELST